MNFSESMKTRAQTKMWVKWKEPVNGYTDMIYYSFETKSSLSKNDIYYGMNKLERLLEIRLKGLYAVAIIYDTKTGKEIKRFS